MAFDSLKNLLGKIGGHAGGKESRQPDPPDTEPDNPPEWIEANRSPFGIRVLDLRNRVFGTTAWTTDKDIAAHFATSRRSNGEQHRDKSPANPVSWPCELSFRYNGEHNEGPMFKAPVMEDKWDMYVFGDRLHAVRSWRDELWIVAHCQFLSDRVEINRIDVDSNRLGNDGLYAVRVLDYLIKSHMSNKIVPHPLPASLESATAGEIAEHSFSLFGRRGLFASFAETIGVMGPSADGTG